MTDDNEGWTHIKPKARRSKRHNNSSSNNVTTTPQHQEQPPKPSPCSASASASDITSEHRALRSEWETSTCCAALRNLLTKTPPSSKTPISRAICLGIGSLEPPDGGWEAKRRAHVQLIAFLIMVEELEKSQDHKIPCIFQEPVFTPSDKAFLASLGHRVVDPPEACNLVDEHSFLFGVHLYRPIYALALRGAAPPAVFVGTGWDIWDQVSLSSEPSDDLTNLQKMERSYKKVHFPRDAVLTTAFSSTSIYFRPASVDKGAPRKGGQEEDENDDEEQDLVDELKSISIS